MKKVINILKKVATVAAIVARFFASLLSQTEQGGDIPAEPSDQEAEA